MGLVGLLAEVIVLGCCAAAVVTNSLLLVTCDLLYIQGVTRRGSLGLFFADVPTTSEDGQCTNLDDIAGSEQFRDAAFNCARVCAMLAFIFGSILLVFGFFKQCLIPLPCSQPLMDLSGAFVQIMLALVYVIWLTEACANSFYCTAGDGGIYLPLTQLFWLAASCFTRCMRPGRHERRDEIKAAKAKKQEEKERKEREQAEKGEHEAGVGADDV